MLRDTERESTLSEKGAAVAVPRKRFTKAARQEIRDEFVRKHGGVFDPKAFLAEAENPKHPAHDWFDWDNDAAGYQWRLHQAREFNRGLTKVKIVVTKHETGDIRHRVTVPSMISPLDGRRSGGGYVAFDERELIRQALRDGKGYAARYRGALVSAGVEADMDRVLKGLQAALA